MKTVLLRTLMETVAVVVCVFGRANSVDAEIKSGENIHPAKVPAPNLNRTDTSTNQPRSPIKIICCSGEWSHEKYFRGMDRQVTSRDAYRVREQFSDADGDVVSLPGDDVTSSVTLSTVLSSFSSSPLSKIDFSSAPQNISSNKAYLSQDQIRNKGVPQPASASNVDILVGVLLPFSGDRPFDIKKVAPAIEKAVDKVATEMGPWNFKSITVLYADSKCNIADAMNLAIQFQERQKTVAFFGPVCDFAIAPVARQARFWNTPVISAGATAFDYYKFKMTIYTTLTRVGPTNLQASIEFLEQLILRHHWAKFTVLYDSTGQDDKLIGFCHLFVEYVHFHLQTVQSSLDMDFYKLDRGGSIGVDYVLRTEVSTDFSGRGMVRGLWSPNPKGIL